MIAGTRVLAALVPEEIFSGPDAVEKEYKAFAKRFHPDLKTSESNEKTFKNLNELHAKAKQKIKIGLWEIPGQLDLEASDHTKYRIRYVKDFTSGVATGYVGKRIVAYVFDQKYSDVADAAIRTVSSFTFPSDEVKKGMLHYLPVLKKHFKTTDGRTVLIYSKNEDQLRLKDVLDFYHGKIDPKHVAWIMSRLCNFVCWLQKCNKIGGITHNDLSVENIFICPEMHTITVIGGWEHSVPSGSRMARVQTGRTVAVMPQSVKNSKIADIKTDLVLIRNLGLELLGDATGMSFIKDTTVPASFSSWLREAPTGDPVKEYKRWDKVLKASFGPRTFVKMTGINHDVVYGVK